GTGNRNRDSWGGEGDEEAPGRARNVARRAAWDGGASASPRRENTAPAARRCSARRRLVKRPGGPATPAGGVSVGGEAGAACGAATSARSSWASREGGDGEDEWDAMARLGKLLAVVSQQ